MDMQAALVSHRAMHARTFTAWLAALLLAACSSTPVSNPQGDAPLQNTDWKLAVLGGVPLSYYPGERKLNLVLQPDGRVTGFSGCNRLMGGYKLQGEQLSFGPTAGTRMACEQRDAHERSFLEMMPRVARWRVMGSWLELQDANGAVLARFEAGR
jgi:heat shock protein HslJ